MPSFNLPYVSIIVPVYNGQATIVQCVESLLAQSYPADRREIIIVDNGSKDKTVALLQPYAQSGNVKLFSETQVLNAYGARNTGARAAKGEILAFTDADCVAEILWLEELVKPFVNPKSGCVVGEVIPAIPTTTIEKYWDRDFLSQKGHEHNKVRKVLGANCAYRHSVLAQIGLFREDTPSGSDAELAHRMNDQTGFEIYISINAIVRHRNVSSLQALLKQYMRYGTAIRQQTEIYSKTTFPSFLRTLYTTMLFGGSFAKRTTLSLAKHVPCDVHKEDLDIYIWRPFLRILVDWAVYIGFKLATSRPHWIR